MNTVTFMGEHVTTATIEIINTPPTVSDLDLSDPPYAEGDAITVGGEWSDPGAQEVTLTVNWGDGVTEEEISEHEDGQTGPFSAPFAFSHVYADDGTYTIQVCADDGVPIPDGVAPSCKDAEISVSNVSPMLEAGLDQVIYKGDRLTLDPAEFNDKGTLDTHTATVNWGDGSAIDEGTITELPFGPPGSTAGADGSVSASHQYVAPPGDYTVEVCVTDDDGAKTCDNFKVTVVHGFLRFCAYANDDEVKIEKVSQVNCLEVPSGVSDDPGDMTLSGVGSRDKVDIKGNVTIQGILTSLTGKIDVDKESIIFGALTAGHDVKVGESAHIHDNITSGHKVEVKKDAFVDGHITAAGEVKINKKATVTSYTEFTSVPPIPDITWVEFSVEPGSESVKVKKGDSLILSPGDYKDVKVEEKATLTLQNNPDSDVDYIFKKFEVKKNAFLQFDLSGGPIVIDVAEELKFEDGVQMQIISSTGDASDILFRVAKKNVELNKEGAYLGTFLAPEGDVKLDANSTLTGALYGEKVEIKKETHILGMPARDLFALLFVTP